MSEWQTIDSAPKDGLFLVYGTWDHSDEYYHGKPWWQFGNGHESGPYGEWDADQKPTHWKPLDAPT